MDIQNLRKRKEKQVKVPVYSRQSTSRKAELIALALRHHVRASHAAMHLGIKQSTATFIIRKHKQEHG